MLRRSRTPLRRTADARTGAIRRRLGRTTTSLAVAALGVALVTPVLSSSAPQAAPAETTAPVRLADATPNPVTPGDFAGYGFDQCLAPTQKAMNVWLRRSPFLSVGIYISGKSRACRDQPNLTPTWVRKQLQRGWRLLPITLGPQASCATRFPRYGDDPTINPRPGKRGIYRRARLMARAEAATAVEEARRLGIVPGSTLWYDLEGFDVTNTHCRESALAFLSAWTTTLHRLDYVSGVYSSAGSGIAMLDDARVERPRAFALPDMIWVARWDNQANTSTSYIREDGWRPGGRVKQYQGGHNETWGGVTINIDRNYLDVGNGHVAPAETRCGGVRVNFRSYPALDTTADRPALVKALQCLLTEQGAYDGRLNGRFTARTSRAISTWQGERGLRTTGVVGTGDWMILHTAGAKPILKIGSTGSAVRRLQRALDSADPRLRLSPDGVYDVQVHRAVRAYQKRTGARVTGITDRPTWKRLARGMR